MHWWHWLVVVGVSAFTSIVAWSVLAAVDIAWARFKARHEQESNQDS